MVIGHKISGTNLKKSDNEWITKLPSQQNIGSYKPKTLEHQLW